MNVDLSKLILHTGYNAFKNDGLVYTGSIDFTTSLTSSQLWTSTTSFTISSFPQFTKFFAFFQEAVDATTLLGSAQWYPNNVAVGSIAAHVTTAPFVGYIGASIYPIINGNTVTVTAELQNPYASTVSLDALNVPFAFIEYTLAN